MLVLTRKLGEQIRIGDSIVVTVTRVHGNRVGIGIEAPAEVPIERSERRLSAARGNAGGDRMTAEAALAGSALEFELTEDQRPRWIIPL